MVLKNLLSKQDAVSLLEIIYASRFCKDEKNLFFLLNSLKFLFNYDCQGCSLLCFNDKHDLGHVKNINVSYPYEWVEQYSIKEWHRIDPLFIDVSAQTSPKPQHWSDIFIRHEKPREMMSIADDFNIIEGYVHGIKSLDGRIGSYHFFSGRILKKAKRTEAILDVILSHIHEAMIRVFDITNNRISQLSSKEIEVLKWCALGKNSWEISMILKISERTVKFHVGNIMRKLDASTRTHAVAIALHERIIEPD